MISADRTDAASQTESGRKRAADLLARAERSELSA
ncbi:phosphonate C-P lyase system protein PhnG, partial [Rhizobium ruizarguesonis]